MLAAHRGGRGRNFHSQVPDYVSFYAQTEGRMMAPGSAGFLGEHYAPMHLSTGMIPENLARLNDISELDHIERSPSPRVRKPEV